MKNFALIYGVLILLLLICLLLWIDRVSRVKQCEILKKRKNNQENYIHSDAIVKMISTRNSFPLIGEQFEHLAEFEEKNQLKINSNLERYIK